VSADAITTEQTSRPEPASQETINEVLKEVDDLVVSAMNEHTIPGVGVGIIRAEKPIYLRGFGLAKVEDGRPVTPTTIFRIGSISKILTAVGLMQLWEQGNFGLDDPVNDYLKSYQIGRPDPAAPPVTFRHMLTHTSGIGELRTYMDLLRPVVGLGVKRDKGVPPLEEYYARGLKPEVYPGTKWAYCDHNFATLGQVIKEISGIPFPQYMIRNVFEPLGMNHTDYLRSERVREELAQGYKFKRSRLEPVKYLEIAVTGAGSVFSDLEDMSRYVAALLGGGRNENGAILKEETLGLMMQPHYPLDGRFPAMGLAFILDDLEGHPIVWHNGGWPGFHCGMFLAPESELGVLVFGNALSRAPDLIAKDILRRILDLPDPASQLPRKGILETPRLWPKLSGFYGPRRGLNTNARIWFAFAGEVEVYVKKNRLALRTLAGPLRKGIALYPVDPDDPLTFKSVHEDDVLSIAFGRSPEGESMHHVRIGLNTLYKRPKLRSLRFRTAAGLGVTAGTALALTGRSKLKRAQETANSP